MNRIIDLKYACIGFVIAGVIGVILATFTELSFWAVFGLVVFSMMVNGFLAEYEVNLPGGFNYPMSPEEIEIEHVKRRKWLLPLRIAIWGIFVVLLIWLAWMFRSNGV